ncbi:hypothetical protein QBC34DRAFT_345852 [Podospora aff. communis PSN243]|uniref:GAR domain-containing protein n=1 Tax=Podospora aff. communis PSN243 TaxID=3040156 RepID=A0AAV9GVF7_9PEZI|nr:hypothetical protein QBC34DRAFT_345852 [Podospora aff. communis PSN243]
MAEPPTPLSSAHLAPRGRHLRTASDSPPRQRGVDDLLSNLNPRTAVEAFRNPSGTLKECMDCATPTEQAFALRAAVASTNIQEWLEELSSWPWPKAPGPAGFEAPTTEWKRLSGGVGNPDEPDTMYCGSLLATEVAKYERRIDEISRAMDDLDVEEIKSQVLHNHIMPLSRPGSPMVDSKRMAMSSLTAYTLMDDLTALITATLVQALPNLSRLTRLMNTWSTRLFVLRKISVYLHSLEDAEVAVRSGWNAIGSSSQLDHRDGSANGESPVTPSTLSRKEFDVMKPILERKVAKAGRDLDAILDTLEGLDDTLPESWVDRMDTLEQDYSEWTVACERKIREADWAKSMRDMVGAAPAPAPKVEEQTRETKRKIDVAPLSLASLPKQLATSSASPIGSDIDASVRYRDESTPPLIKVHRPQELVEGNAEHVLHIDDVSSSPSRSGEGEPGKRLFDAYDGPHAYDDRANGPSAGVEEYDESVIVYRRARSDSGDTSELDIPEPDLPTLPRSRRDSDLSNPSTIVHGLQSELVDFSSDQLEHGTPEIPRVRDADLGAIPSDELSPGNSPQDFRSSTRSVSVSFNDMPTVAEIPDDDLSGPTTPLGSSFVMDDEVSRDLGSPGKASTSNSDEHLQQQISEILEGVPAKIRLTSEPPAINLNPPDFTMPTRKTPKHDLYPRSHSSLSTVSNLSSRAGTPSFTLAPAYNRNSRQRHQQRGNQEIKLYHLSRSNGEAPIKLFIRCVGEQNERVMVRVGGGWADLGEYLKEYASHHGRRSGHSKVEIKDLPSAARAASTPPTRPASAQESYSPITPLSVRKSRRSAAAEEATANMLGASGQSKTPLARSIKPDTPSPEGSIRSRSSSRVSWPEEDSSLGMAGPKAKQIEMSEESKAWVESVKEKVRLASGERKVSESSTSQLLGGKFGEMGKVGATKRLFRRQG